MGWFVEPARFAVVSMLGTGVDFLVLWLLVAHIGWGPVPAKRVAIEATIVNTFIWNNVWTFRGRATPRSRMRRFAAFHIASAGSFALGLLTITLLVALIGPRFYLLYNVVTLPLNLAWTYLWSVRVVWRAPRAPGPAASYQHDDHASSD